ncbi:unnamed protein product [Caretta caretta]
MRAMPPAAVSGGGGEASAGRAERPPCCRSQSERGEGAGTAGHLNHCTAVRGGYRGASRSGTLGPLPPAQGCRIAARRGAQVTVDNVSPAKELRALPAGLQSRPWRGFFLYTGISRQIQQQFYYIKHCPL